MANSEARRVVFGLGSNLGKRAQTLRAAVRSLESIPGISGARASPLYETVPVGGPLQRDFLNAALVVTTSLSAQSLLRHALAIESRHGRIRNEKNGPRTLDIDILWIENEVLSTPEIIIPHPRLCERAFALAPLLDVAPDAIDPQTGEHLARHLARVGMVGVRRAASLDSPTQKC